MNINKIEDIRAGDVFMFEHSTVLVTSTRSPSEASPVTCYVLSETACFSFPPSADDLSTRERALLGAFLRVIRPHLGAPCLAQSEPFGNQCVRVDDHDEHFDGMLRWTD